MQNKKNKCKLGKISTIVCHVVNALDHVWNTPFDRKCTFVLAKCQADLTANMHASRKIVNNVKQDKDKQIASCKKDLGNNFSIDECAVSRLERFI